MRSFREQQPKTTLLVMNQSSPIILLSRIPAPKQGTVKLSLSLLHGVIPGGELSQKLPPPPPSSPSPKELAEKSTTVTDSGLGPEPSRLSQESQEPSVSPVAKASTLSRQHLISLMMMNNNQRVQSIPALRELLSEMSLPAISLHP